MNIGTIEIINQGLSCLSQHLGAQVTEQFIAAIMREHFDYTRWRQNFVNNIKTFDDLDDLLKKTKEKAAYHGNPEIIL